MQIYKKVWCKSTFLAKIILSNHNIAYLYHILTNIQYSFWKLTETFECIIYTKSIHIILSMHIQSDTIWQCFAPKTQSCNLSLRHTRQMLHLLILFYDNRLHIFSHLQIYPKWPTIALKALSRNFLIFFNFKSRAFKIIYFQFVSKWYKNCLELSKRWFFIRKKFVCNF